MQDAAIPFVRDTRDHTRLMVVRGRGLVLEARVDQLAVLLHGHGLARVGVGVASNDIRSLHDSKGQVQYLRVAEQTMRAQKFAAYEDMLLATSSSLN